MPSEFACQFAAQREPTGLQESETHPSAGVKKPSHSFVVNQRITMPITTITAIIK
jgi:hypothetical protein